MRFLFTILSFFFTSVMMAVPAHRSWFSYQQADGTFLELMPIGDEHFHYYITRDYVPVVDENDAFYYAKVENGKLMATSLLVHEQNRRTIGERMTAEKAKSAFREVDFKRASRPHRLPRQSNGAYIGSRKGLIILANFEDVKFGFEATNIAYRVSSVTEVTSGVERFEVESAELNYWYRCEVVPCILDNDVA